MVAKRDGDPEAPPEVISYYEQFPEESRLMSGPFRLEFERTKEIVSRVLPKPPSVVVDVGGAAGTSGMDTVGSRHTLGEHDAQGGPAGCGACTRERTIHSWRKRSLARGGPE